VRNGTTVIATPITAMASEVRIAGWNPSSSAAALPAGELDAAVPASIAAVGDRESNRAADLE
jgi:hypothetical protein